MENSVVLLALGFFVIAIIYASVGFGGGSSYLALLAVWGAPFETLRATGLVCNIIVVSGGAYIFYKAGHLSLKRSLPFVAVSVPAAFLGGLWTLEERVFFLLLGSALILAAMLLWFQATASNYKFDNHRMLPNAAISGGVGFLSGLVGIGGGIFLSPLLHLARWDDAKKISALASFFILVNSASGLAGQLSSHIAVDWSLILPLAVAVLTGGQIGSRLGANVFNPLYIKRITAILVFLAGVNILKAYV